jgi:hypothetical protein
MLLFKVEGLMLTGEIVWGPRGSAGTCVGSKKNHCRDAEIQMALLPRWRSRSQG